MRVGQPDIRLCSRWTVTQKSECQWKENNQHYFCFDTSHQEYGIFNHCGIIVPPEIISLRASSTGMSRMVTSFFGTKSKKPDVGFGVVGRKMLKVSSLIESCTHPFVSWVIKPMITIRITSANKPRLGILRWFVSM